MATTDSNLDHQGLEVLDAEACWRLVRDTPVGRLAFLGDGEPMILPVNHAVTGRRIVFRTAKGALLEQALMSRSVAFEVDGFDAIERTGWSVIARGQASIPDDSSPLEAMHLDAWADAVNRDQWVSILVEEITGRRIARSARAAS